MPSPSNTHCSEQDRRKIADAIGLAFNDKVSDINIISCRHGGTPFSSFSHISAEVDPVSINSISDFQPLIDPAWIPIDLLGNEYLQSFQNTDWEKVTYTESFDPNTLARIFLINAQNGKSFIIITSE